MQPANQNDMETKVDARLRIIRIIWFAIFVSVGLYYLLTLLTGQPQVNPNGILSIALVAIGMVFVSISLALKQKYLRQSVDKQSAGVVQNGYVLAFALCEVPALLAMVDFFVTGNRYYYVLIVISAGGQLLNFPRRKHVLDASFKGLSI
jgi:hypothetical protein